MWTSRVTAFLVLLCSTIACAPEAEDDESSSFEEAIEQDPSSGRSPTRDAATRRDAAPSTPSTRDAASPEQPSDAGAPTTVRDAGSEEMPPAEDAGEDPPTTAAPSYEVVFPKAKVNELTITITPQNWQAMLDDMTRYWGARGSAGRPPMGGQAGGAVGGFPDHDPIYADVTIQFEQRTWSHVGLRFKGNSSLRAAWSSNDDRFPFRIDFDEFEDQHPETKNQRFHGFKTLSLSNNLGDPTHMREALYYDLSAEAGLVTPARGFYEVFLDRGEGPKSLGLYTVLEVVRETVIPRHFEDASGSLFKAEQMASNLAANARASLMSGFEAEGGIGRKEEEADWSRLEALHDALHASTRTSDAAAWRSRLEAVFDVPSYLHWLALSTLFQHWDTYGRMPHNYYLYDDPMTQRLHWISWDHNFVLGASPGGFMGGGGGGRGGLFGAVSYDKSNAGANWPLISFLYADATYRRVYDDALKELLEDVFAASSANALIDQYGAILKPRATKSSSPQAYDQALQALKSAVMTQITAARTYLGGQ